MILHNRYTQVQQAIASFQEQIAYLQQQVLEYQEHLQKLETLEAAAESAVTQVANAIQMARAIDPSQELVIKQALLELFELPVLPEYTPDTDNTPTAHHPDTESTDSEQPPHEVDTTIEVQSEYIPDTDSTPTAHHPDTDRTDSEQPPHEVDIPDEVQPDTECAPSIQTPDASSIPAEEDPWSWGTTGEVPTVTLEQLDAMVASKQSNPVKVQPGTERAPSAQAPDTGSTPTKFATKTDFVNLDPQQLRNLANELGIDEKIKLKTELAKALAEAEHFPQVTIQAMKKKK